METKDARKTPAKPSTKPPLLTALDMDDLEPKIEAKLVPEVKKEPEIKTDDKTEDKTEIKIGPNQNIENARLNLPKSKYKPDFFSPKYANYIWKEHAPNFIKFIIAMEAGQPDEMVALTDAAIQDLSG